MELGAASVEVELGDVGLEEANTIKEIAAVR
jgi:hypothetical protein